MWYDYVIPRNPRVILPIHLLDRYPDYWSCPDDFLPERWLNKEECNARHKFCFIQWKAETVRVSSLLPTISD
jgi:cytochrome P450